MNIAACFCVRSPQTRRIAGHTTLAGNRWTSRAILWWHPLPSGSTHVINETTTMNTAYVLKTNTGATKMPILAKIRIDPGSQRSLKSSFLGRHDPNPGPALNSGPLRRQTTVSPLSSPLLTFVSLITLPVTSNLFGASESPSSIVLNSAGRGFTSLISICIFLL